ncbi:hypothetical protein [Parahaliea aestuarii]|uniref:Uncharacterized protein n=1 Tax=Parahaliea aestuarii TaxID=1852021 RepID=A0A5C9A5K8_9GAMM|nr:hypothetical protein [Parahaliea aestuarii]TXS94441.1 hypothetical protein FVW59_00535 [Parahaliea aestuarii]
MGKQFGCDVSDDCITSADSLQAASVLPGWKQEELDQCSNQYQNQNRFDRGANVIAGGRQ